MNVAERFERIAALASKIGRKVQLMEVCGTHTMSAFRSGLRSLLPEDVVLLSGPGCPVCVTPDSYLDHAMAIAREPETLVATFGDMIRVPGRSGSLETARAKGAAVQVVYSPRDALDAARARPGRRVVFLGVGFETTIPAVAWTIREAARCGLTNYMVLCAHKTIPRAMAALLAADDVRIDGFMCPGHVSVVTGADVYGFVAEKHGVPCVVAGFEPADMAEAIEMLLLQITEQRAAVEIQYRRSVDGVGNREAQKLIAEVFEPCDSEWRGLGVIAGSGLRVRAEFKAHDAAAAYPYAGGIAPEPAANTGCRCGEVLKGVITPAGCPLFRTRCTPDSPVGACMVSSEGTCAAYYKYSRRNG